MEKLNADAGHAILEAAYLDNLLQQLLLHSMPKMSNGLAKELFGRSLNSFAAKINLACALRLIDAKTRCDLLAVKSVRNVFAHAEHALGFRHAKIIKEARPLRHHGHEGSSSTLPPTRPRSRSMRRSMSSSTSKQPGEPWFNIFRRHFGAYLKKHNFTIQLMRAVSYLAGGAASK